MNVYGRYLVLSLYHHVLGCETRSWDLLEFPKWDPYWFWLHSGSRTWMKKSSGVWKLERGKTDSICLYYHYDEQRLQSRKCLELWVEYTLAVFMATIRTTIILIILLINILILLHWYPIKKNKKRSRLWKILVHLYCFPVLVCKLCQLYIKIFIFLFSRKTPITLTNGSNDFPSLHY